MLARERFYFENTENFQKPLSRQPIDFTLNAEF